MTYERIDVSSVYVHLVWAYFFCIYLIMSCMGIYAIWTDLKSSRGRDIEVDLSAYVEKIKQGRFKKS